MKISGFVDLDTADHALKYVKVDFRALMRALKALKALRAE